MPLSPEIKSALARAIPDRLAAITPALAVDGPPCVRCEHWNPTILAGNDGTYNGIRLCHTDNAQYRDFSCFSPRKT